MDDQKLPPLPEYGKQAGNFWKDSEIIPLDNTPMTKCDHQFKYAKDGAICTICNFGLLGHDLEIRSGKLFAKGEPIGL